MTANRRIAHLLALPLRLRPLETAFRALCGAPWARGPLKCRQIAFAHAADIDRFEIRLARLDGYDFYVNIAEPLGVVAYFLRDPGIDSVALRLVRENDDCLDAGANMGSYVFALAHATAPRGRVLAFEPQPRYATLLRASVERGGLGDRVFVDDRALWSKSGEKRMLYVSTDPNNSGTSSLIDRFSQTDHREPIVTSTVSAAEALAERGIKRCRLMKIDVEGVELDVLLGMKEMLGRVDFVVMETREGSAAHDFLTGHGFRSALLHSDEDVDGSGNAVPGTLVDRLYVAESCIGELASRVPDLRLSDGP